MKELISDFPGWPSGKAKLVIEIRHSPKQIAHLLSIEFRRELDNLDWHLGSFFVDQDLGPVAFQKYDTPLINTKVFVDSKVDTGLAIQRLKFALDLSDVDIVWRTTA